MVLLIMKRRHSLYKSFHQSPFHDLLFIINANAAVMKNVMWKSILSRNNGKLIIVIYYDKKAEIQSTIQFSFQALFLVSSIRNEKKIVCGAHEVGR